MSFQSAQKNQKVAVDLYRFLKTRQTQKEEGKQLEPFHGFVQLCMVKYGYTIDDLTPIMKSFGLEIVNNTAGFDLQKLGGGDAWQ